MPAIVKRMLRGERHLVARSARVRDARSRELIHCPINGFGLRKRRGGVVEVGGH